MNILFANYEYPPLGGGGGVFTRTLARELADRGHNIYVVTTNAKLPTMEKDVNVLIRRVNCFRNTITWTPKLPMYIFPLASFQAMNTFVKKHDIDLINAHFAIPSGISPAVISKIKRVPLVTNIMGADIHDPTKYNLQRPLLDLIVKKVLNSSELIICPSSDMKTRAEKLTRTPIDIIPYGIDYEKFASGIKKRSTKRKLDVDDRDLIVLTVARLIPRKSFDTSLRAIKKAKKIIGNLKYVIVGDGPEREKILKTVRELGLEDTVILTSRVPDTELPDYYAISDVFLMTSLHEAFGIVLLEAMASGMPVVVSDIGGMKDIVANGRNGYLCPVDDVTAFAERIEFLLTNQTENKKQGDFGKELVSKNYTYKKITDRYEEIFDRTVSTF